MMKRAFTCLLAGILFGNFIHAAEASVVITVVAPPLTPNCFPPPPGLVGWWPGEGSTIDLISGDNGTLSDSGATYATGEVGQGFRFDGTNGYLQIPDSAALKPTNVTLEAWVWLDPNANAVNSGPENIIFKKNTWDDFFEGYTLLKTTVDNGNGTFSDRFQTVVSSGGHQVYIDSTTIAQRGVWYHVAATYDGNTLTLFVNGVAEASAVAGFALDYGTKPVFIGATGEDPPYSAYFAGIIDEPSIYNRALTTNEIAAIYHAGTTGKCDEVSQPPYILTPPAGQTVVEGGEVDLSVAVVGLGPFSYQWMFNGKAIAGANADSLSLANVHPYQAGSYKVKVSNATGSVTSAPAIVTVITQNILIYTYVGNERDTAPGSETTYGFSGEMIFIPETTNATFIGWAIINGKKKFWITPAIDYSLFTIKGSQNHTYTVFGKAFSTSVTPNDAHGENSLVSFIHRGQNVNLVIGTGKTISFPNAFTFNETAVYPDSLTTSNVMQEASANYSFVQSSTKTANDTGQTKADLVSALFQSLIKQGYQGELK